MIELDVDYRSRRPGGQLGRAVELVWYARGTVPYRSELISPTGSTVALLILGDPIRQTTAGDIVAQSSRGLVIGPHPAPVANEPLGETFAVGVVTTCVGAQAALGLRPGPLRGRVVGLERTQSHLVHLRAVLGDLGQADPESLLDAVQAHLERWLDLSSPGLARVEAAVGALVAEPRRPIVEIAHELGVTHAHLDREFARIVGLAPRALARLLTLRRVLTFLEPQQAPLWAQLATEHGWADQAHFSRDFRRHTGVSPTQFLRTQRALGAGRSDGVGFTPDLDSRR